MATKTNMYLPLSLTIRKNLGQETTKRAFLSALKDYFSGKVSSEDLAGISTWLYYEGNRPFDIEAHWPNDLSKNLLIAADLDIYEQDQDKEKLAQLLDTLKMYLDQNS